MAELNPQEMEYIKLRSDGVQPAGRLNFFPSKDQKRFAQLEHDLREAHSDLFAPGEDGKTPRVEQALSEINPSKERQTALALARSGNDQEIQRINHEADRNGTPPINTMRNAAGHSVERADPITTAYREQRDTAQQIARGQQAIDSRSPEQRDARLAQQREDLGLPAQPQAVTSAEIATEQGIRSSTADLRRQMAGDDFARMLPPSAKKEMDMVGGNLHLAGATCTDAGASHNPSSCGVAVNKAKSTGMDGRQ